MFPSDGGSKHKIKGNVRVGHTCERNKEGLLFAFKLFLRILSSGASGENKSKKRRVECARCKEV